MKISYYLYHFISTSLVNNSTVHPAGFMTETDKVQDLSVEMPSGNIFDPHGTQDAPIIPGEVTQVMFVEATTPAGTNTVVNTNYRALVGKRGTLYAKHADGTGAVSCTARLIGYTEEPVISGDLVYAQAKVTMKFRKITNWA